MAAGESRTRPLRAQLARTSSPDKRCWMDARSGTSRAPAARELLHCRPASARPAGVRTRSNCVGDVLLIRLHRWRLRPSGRSFARRWRCARARSSGKWCSWCWLITKRGTRTSTSRTSCTHPQWWKGAPRGMASTAPIRSASPHQRSATSRLAPKFIRVAIAIKHLVVLCRAFTLRDCAITGTQFLIAWESTHSISAFKFSAFSRQTVAA
jgi:hypothetical protein